MTQIERDVKEGGRKGVQCSGISSAGFELNENEKSKMSVK